ncbi:MAG: DUF4931 domain-containing protein [Candidatus Komeilibacteria bacterium]|nr:DUF4931 domain-containing protein [Candidatus Komeilibacteria bacterium]
MLSHSEIRKHYLLDQYVIVTPSRSNRPRDIEEDTGLKRSGECFFCPDSLDESKVIDSVRRHGAWQTAAIANKYPAVTLDNTEAYGHQEVIIETRKHGADLGSLSVNEIFDVLTLYQRRTHEIGKIEDIDYILIFKNAGGKAGASLLHAHSQVFATKLLPPEVEEEMQIAKRASDKLNYSVYKKIMEDEERAGQRVVFSDDSILAFCPYASQFHYEVWLFTRRQLDNISDLNDAELYSTAEALKIILGKLNKYNIDYNFFLHQVISDQGQHFYIKIQPRDSIWGGVELGSGLIINSISPEAAAVFYRS